VYPYFNQGWNLFVPPPDCNYRLFAEYENKGTRKKDIFQEVLLQHQNNRFKGYGPLLLAFSNSIYYFEKTTELQKQLNGPVLRDSYFEIIENTALNYLRATEHKKIEKAKLLLVIENINSGTSRVYYNKR
jgi:hypothetical protein